jgi:hypothetical protein
MATEMIDIGLIAVSSGEDLLISSGGDFVMAENTAWHQRDLILNNKGEYKENPTIGVGAFDYLDDENIQDLIRAITVAFTVDGMQVEGINLSAAGVITSDAYYP